MNKTNLYWPVYKNLEKELIQLSDQIHFDDNQLSIYSVKISELLIRCSVEIESISKDLYITEGGTKENNNDLYFDTDCIEFLENKWLLSKKQVILSSSNFHFIKDKNKIFTPLKKANKRGTSGSDWKKAYMAVKHNRVNNLKEGNIKNLIRAMAALFVLNIYYKDEVYNFEKDGKAMNFPINIGSDLFAIKLHRWISYGGEGGGDGYGKRDDFDECIYLTKYTEKSLKENREAAKYTSKKGSELLSKHPKIIKYLETNNPKDYTGTGNSLVYDVLGKADFIHMSLIAFKKQIEVLENTEYEAVLNKSQF